MAATGELDPDTVIEALGLVRHPEGGWFAETWRDATAEGDRGHGTAIYFLLKADEVSHWHTVDAVEIWHHHAGGPLDLLVADGPEGPVRASRLGPDVAAGQRPQGHVPAGALQAARPVDGAVLVSCTLSPAFLPAGFVLAPPGWKPGPGAADRLT
ncbi:cupin domain-containing protein [soil metagenome]